MRNLFSLIFLINVVFAFSQKAKVTYIATTSNYLENLNNKENSIKYTDVIKDANDIEYVLFINRNKSYYKKEESLKVDINTINMTSVLGGRGVYYYSLTDDVTLLLKDVKKISKKELLIKYEKIKWNLTNETKKIGKYTCLKATAIIMRKYSNGYREKEITAWYAPEIPLNFGPKFYNGLPGLILILQEDEKLQLIAKNIDLNTKQNIIIPDISRNYEIITYKDYEKMLAKMFDNFRKKKKKKR